MVRAAMALAGGLGGTHQEMCGALSGGAMVIGILLGPLNSGEDERLMRKSVATFRERFLNEIGPTQCAALRDGLYGSQGREECRVLVQRAVRILMEVLNEGLS